MRVVISLLTLTAIGLAAAPAALAQTDGGGGAGPIDDEGLPQIVVGPASQKRFKLALAPIRCDGAGAMCDQVAAQLARNLEMSTFFELLNPQSFVANMDKETLDVTNWPDWFNVDAAHLVKGTISGSGPYDVELRFYDVFGKQAVSVKGQSHSGLAGKAVHAAVDQFINGVIEAVTGEPGIFGSKLVFAVKTGLQTRGIGIVEMDGAGQGGIAGGDTINMLPSFAAGGVMYTSFRDGKPDLFIGSKKLTNNGYHYRGAAMGPGGKIAASVSVAGGNSNIYLLDGGGNPSTPLTHGEGQNVSPTWSPDGSKIAFVSDRAGGPQIYVMGAGGGGASRVTMAGGYNSTPSWGKNGLIAFAAMTGAGSDIFTTDEGGSLARITQNQGVNTDPCWSPDGRYLAFVSARDGGKRIYLSSADGRWQFPITEKASGYSTPKWGL
jgi:TolB protein